MSVRDYGAIGNDIHDDTLAFRNALNAIRNTGGTCFVPHGTYKISTAGIMGGNNIPALTDDMHLVGSDGLDPATNSPLAFLRLHGELTAVVITCDGDGWSIEKLGMDMMDFYSGLPGRNPVTVLARNPASSRWLIDKCWFINTGRFAVVIRGNHYQLSNCYIKNNLVPTFPNGLGPEGVLTTTWGTSPAIFYPSYGRYINNVIDGCSGYDSKGNNHLFYGNTCKNMSMAAGFFQSGTAANEQQNRDNTFIQNTAMFGQEGPDNIVMPHQPFAQARGFEIYTPYTLMIHNTAHDNCGGGFGLSCRSSIIAFNRSVNNGRDSGNPMHSNDRSGFIASGLGGAGQSFVNNSRSIYLENVATDTRAVGSKTQQYGLQVLGPPATVSCLAVIGNNFHGNRMAEGDYRNVQPNISTLKGRDMFSNILDEKQRDMIRTLLDSSEFNITDAEYITLNQLLTGSSMPRP